MDTIAQYLSNPTMWIAALLFLGFFYYLGWNSEHDEEQEEPPD